MRLQICLFGPDIDDSTTFKRCARFVDAGFLVTSFTFSRDLMEGRDNASWTSIVLASIRNSFPLHRFALLPVIMTRLLLHRKSFAEANVIYARNLDMALLALFARVIFRSKALLVYEVLDVHKVLLRPDGVGKLMRFLERSVLNRTSLLVLSSRGFFDNYFSKTFNHIPEMFLLENKISIVGKRSQNLFSYTHRSAIKKREFCSPVTIGFIGRLACRKSLELLLSVAREMPDKVRVKLAGVTYSIPSDLLEPLISQPNIDVTGQYLYPDELGEAYQGVDLNWCLNFRDGDSQNNVWLLPNRYYEGGYYGIPVLARGGSEMGRLSTELDVGWQLEEPYDEALIDLINSMSPQEYDEKSKNLRGLDYSSFVDQDDHARLCAKISEMLLEPRHK